MQHIIEVVQECITNQNPILDFKDTWATKEELTSEGLLFNLLKKCEHVQRIIIRPIYTQNLNALDTEDRTAYLEWIPLILDDYPFLTFPEFKQLTSLTFSNIKLTAVGAATIGTLPNIQNLDFSNSDLANLIPLSKLKTLRSLKMADCRFLNPTHLAFSSSLETLSLDRCELNNTLFLAELKHLKHLSLRSNQLTSISELSQLQKLQTLDVSNNHKIRLDGLKQIDSLTELLVDNCSFRSVDHFLNLKLRKISAASNHITGVTFPQTSTLTSLNLSNNSIRTFYNIGACPDLLELYVDSNSITNLQGIQAFTRLLKLDISNNLIETLEPLVDLKNLEWLNLNKNKVADIQCLSQNQKLNTVYFAGNKITSISDDFFNKCCQNLFIISFDHIHLLKELAVRDLTFEEAADLRDLEKKYIYQERIGDSEIATFEKLVIEIIFLSNPIQAPSRDIFLQGLESIDSFFKNQKVAELIPFREAKIIILGEPDAGKTNLLKYFLNKDFDESKSVTRGVNIAKKTFDHNGNLYTINFWDFGGQEVQQSVHQYFLTDNTLYLIVLNAVTDEQPDKYLEFLDNHAPNSPFIIISNKDDLNGVSKLKNNKLTQEYENRLVSKEIRISLKQAANVKYCNGDPVLFTRRKEELSNLYRLIVQTFLSLPHIEQKFLANYKMVKDLVEDIYKQQKLPYITMQDFINYCKAKELVSGTEISLLKQLNFIGTVRYIEQPNLSGIHILNPEWLSDGIYRIITDNDARNKHLGKITKKQISGILKQSAYIDFVYQDNDIDYIITMMKHFRVAYQDDNNKSIYLPDLFPDDIPNTVDKKEFKSGSLHYFFTYNKQIPSYIISRIIVNLFKFVRGTDYWNKGIVIKNNEYLLNPCEALLEQNDRVIDIWVRGKDIQSFFAIIREALRSAHEDTFSGVDEMIDLGEESVPYKFIMNYKLDGEAFYKGNVIDPLTGKLKRYSINEILGRFEPLKKLEESRFTIDTGGGNFYGQFGGEANVQTNTREIQSTSRENEEHTIFKKQKLYKWKRDAWIVLILGLIVTSILILFYKENSSPFVSKETWLAFKNSFWVQLIAVILGLIWNVLILKLWYERIFDKSKQKAYVDTLTLGN